MNPLMRQIINQRINQVEANELYSYAIKYGVPISRDQAEKIAARVRGARIDLFQPSGVEKLQRILEEEIGPERARQLRKRFDSLAADLKRL